MQPYVPECGDGWIQFTEACDDGNKLNGDGCSSACQITPVLLSHCGDALTDTGEECDLGENNSNDLPDGCRTNCRRAFCGDGVLDTNEPCDDGNANEWDGCTWDCQVSVCGNGIIETVEECDAGGENSDTLANSCRTMCRSPRCGDGVTDAGEECDDGNSIDGDGCMNACVIACPEGSQKIDGRCLILPAEPADDCGVFCAVGRAWTSFVDWLFSFFA